MKIMKNKKAIISHFLRYVLWAIFILLGLYFINYVLKRVMNLV